MAVGAEELEKTEPPPEGGLLTSWVTTTDHKKIGIMYLLSSVLFMVIGGLEALLMRIQLWSADLNVVGPDTFNALFTMHGTTMVFFVVMPCLTGFANYIVPLMIGARDMAFPRLNAFSFWCFFFSGVLLYYSVFAGGAPTVGWFGYAPLTEHAFSRGNSTDFWVLALLVNGVGSIGGAVNLVTTILALRAPGMTLGKVPLFTWMMLFTGIEMLVAFPPLTAALVMLLFDRSLGSHFFGFQGSSVLWQHLFWFFGHPEVYIMALPAFGIISEVVPVFSRKVIFGYESVAAATIAIAFISFGVWAHHMFAVGMNLPLETGFAGATFLIAIPTGIKVFNWMATMYGGKLRFRTPLLFALGFLSMFVIGGLSGIMLAAAPFDLQVTDTYFVVAHFHYVAFGGLLFALTAGAYYWFPKITGRLLSERLGAWHFWLLLIGFNLTFGPMHFAGLFGMPRRIYTYGAGLGWEPWNRMATVGAFVLGAAILVFLYNVVVSLRRGEPAGDDPWDAWTLEWATTSPPAAYNFETIPTVRSRRPLWDVKHPDDPDWFYEPYQPLRSQRLPLSVPQVGMLSFLLTEVFFFATLIVVFLFFLGKSGPPLPAEVLRLPLALVGTLCLLTSSVTIHMAGKAWKEEDPQRFLHWWGATIALGCFFLLCTGYEWSELIMRDGLTISRNVFGSTYFTLVGFHALHVTLGVVLMITILFLALRTPLLWAKPVGIELVSWYWHFVDAVWIVVFTVVYLVAR